MNLVVVGAGGRTGRLVVDQALAAGYQVTAFVRHPEAMPRDDDGLRVVVGDVMEPDDVSEAVRGSGAIIVTLGVRNRGTTMVFSQGIRNIVRAASASGTGRIMVMSSQGLDVSHLPIPQRLVSRFVVDRLLRNIHLDLMRMEDELERSSMDWTVLRVPPLNDRPGTGHYRVAIEGHLVAVNGISRADVADFLVMHLNDVDTYRARVDIG